MSVLATTVRICWDVQAALGAFALLRARAWYRGLDKLHEDVDNAGGAGRYAGHQTLTDEAVSVEHTRCADLGCDRCFVDDARATIARTFDVPGALVEANPSIDAEHPVVFGVDPVDPDGPVVAQRREFFTYAEIVPSTQIPETGYWYLFRDQSRHGRRQLCLWSDCTDDATPGGFYCRGHRPIMSTEVLP